MKMWTSYHTFDHPWETVVKAACRKYPNPCNPCVLGTDVIDRRVRDGVLYSHRLVTSEWRFPTWISPLFGHRGPCYAIEWSEVNPEDREMVVKTVNVSLGKHVSVGEEVRYKPDPKDPQKTLLTQQAIISISGVPLIDQMERLLTMTIEQNAKKGRQAMEWVIERLQSEVKDIATSAVKSTDDLLNQTRRQIDDITSITKRGMDDLQNAAKKSFDEFHNLTVPPPPQSIPKL
ncbi:PREDICTED: protein slowmo [Dufourea novaeangliae]|uniref:Protein slowmo n=1 Tax=Dufourea novaeangliae TaxID=178035 RepID=A0A154P5N8_DUFNO|nr:PREDICTED: protein slowmo [Dufourea novaeangliae]KZC07172.1 Protein slowmo [Dufourea novaeangliae]